MRYYSGYAVGHMYSGPVAWSDHLPVTSRPDTELEPASRDYGLEEEDGDEYIPSESGSDTESSYSSSSCSDLDRDSEDHETTDHSDDDMYADC